MVNFLCMNKSISFFLFFLQLLFISSAYSETVARVYRYSPPGGGTFATLQNACDGLVAYKNLDEPGAFLISIDQQPYPSQSSCLVQNQPRFNSQSRVYVSVDMGCPPNTQLNGENMCDSSCVAPSVYDAVTSSCVTSVDCTDGKTIDSGTFHVSSPPLNTGCSGGCSVLYVGSAPTISCGYGASGSIGVCYSVRTGRYVATGNACGQSTEPPVVAPLTNPDSPENKCVKSGQSFGTANGLTVCVPIGTANSPVPPPLPDATKNNVVTNPNGTITTTTSNTTINNNGTVSTTTNTTTTNADGTNPVTVTEKSEQDKQGFCEENPNLKICNEEPSTFTGSCSSSFSCTGDAIQCAISKEQHKRHCELFEKETSMTTEGKKLIDGTATDNNPAKIENRENVNLAGMINEGSNIGGGSFTDKIISLPGGGVTLPFAKLNFIMQVLGGFILAAAYINAARIVGVR